MKATLKILCAMLLLVNLYSCSKDKPGTGSNNYTQTYIAEMNGVKAIPTNSSPGFGTFTGTFTSSNRTLTYSITYSGMTPTSGDIRQGTLTTEGALEINLTNLNGSPLTGSIVLSAAQENSLNSGMLWVKLSSLIFSNGEIRGQIVKR